MANSGEINILIKATQEGFADVINKLQDISKEMKGITQAAKMLDVFKDMNSTLGKLNTTLDKTTKSLTDQSKATTKAAQDWKNMEFTVQSLAKGVSYLLQIQLRWYAARTLLFGAVDLPKAILANMTEYAGNIETARGEMLRWAASSGTVTEQVRGDTERLLNNVRKITTEFPVEFKDMSETVQAFLGAGLDYRVVDKMVPSLARLRTAFNEIDMKQFAVALSGAFKVFKDSMKDLGDEATIFSAILDKMSAAQARGIIRPEQFTKVLQYLAQVSKMTGFTLDQMLALSVAITDTGIPAANASRLLSTTMQQMTQKNFVQGLKQYFGVEIQKDIPLANQFFDILRKIKSTIGGQVTPGWMRVFTQEMGITSNSLKVFLSLLDRLDEYDEVFGNITGAKGGVALAANVQAMSFQKQWIIFKNILNEIGRTGGSGFTEFLKNITAGMVDMARGILVAVDATGMYSDQLDKLGSVGKTTYDVVKVIMDLFDESTGVIGKLVNIVGTLIEWMGKLGKALVDLNQYIPILNTIFDILVLKLIGKILPGLAVLTGSTATLKDFFAIIVAGITAVGLQIKTILLYIGRFAYMNKWLIIITGLVEGFLFVMKQLNKEFDDFDKAQQKFNEEIGGLSTTAAIDMAIVSHKERQKQLYNEAMSMNKQNTSVLASGAMDAKAKAKLNESIREGDYILALQQKRRSIADKEEKAKKDEKGQPSPNLDKSYGSQMAEAERAIANAQLAILQEQQKTEITMYRDMHQMGLISEQELATKSIEISKATLAKKLEIIADEKAAVEAGYADKLSKEKDAGKRELLEKQRERDRKKIELQTEQAQGEHTRLLWNNWTRGISEQLKIWEDKYATYVDIKKTQEEMASANLKAQLDEQGKQVDWYYQNNYMKASQYYDEKYSLIQKEYDREVALLTKLWNLQKSIWEKQLENTVAGTPQYENIKNAIAKGQQDFEKAKGDAQIGAKSKAQDLRRQEVLDIEQTYGEQGALGVLKRSFGDYVREAQKMGTQLKKVFDEIGKAIEDTFSDALFDMIEGKFKSLEDYATAMLKSIAQAMARMLAQQAAASMQAGIMSMIFGAWGKGGVFSGGNVQQFAGGGVVYQPTVFPMAKGYGVMGEAGPEAIMPLKRNAQGKLGVESSGGGGVQDVQIILENKSGIPLAARPGNQNQQKKDDKTVVKTIILDLAMNDPQFRQMFGMR